MTLWTVTRLDSSVYEMLQARILEWVTISFSRISLPPRDRTRVSHLAGGFFTIWATRGAIWRFLKKLKIGLSYDPAIPLLGVYREARVLIVSYSLVCLLKVIFLTMI